MSEQTSVLQLSRSDSTPWGFRIQGGKEFGTPLSVLKVNPNSLAQRAGLQPGDAILQIGGHKTESMRHKEAQDTIMNSGNNIELLVERGRSTIWRPKVTAVGELPKTIMANGSVVTKTSLRKEHQQTTQISSKHNIAAKPFDSSTVTAVMHKQFNSPAALYSMQNIAETLSAHTEILATGVKGINFMKEDAPINTQSAVYRLVHEEETSSGKASPVPTSPSVPPLVRHIEAPALKPKPSAHTQAGTGGQALCTECGTFISGVFARIGDKSLHPECFKCNTCGVSLKNVGYFNINNKLYCDFHAKAASKMSSVEAIKEAVGKPAAPLSPVRLPQHSTGFSSVHSVSPIPFHRMPSEVHHVESPQQSQSPLPFTSISAPPPEIGSGPTYPSSISRPAPTKPTTTMGFSKTFTQINRSHSPVTGGSKFMWPPQKHEAPVGKSTFESIASQETSTYTPPQGIQHSTSSQSSSFTAKNVSSVESKTVSMFQSSSHVESSGISALSSTASTRSSSQQLGSESTTFPTSIQQPTVEPVSAVPTVTPIPASISPPKEASTKPVHSTPSSGRAQAPGIGSRPAPRRGRGQLITAGGTRIPICAACASPIRGPFITALSKSWCPDHFLCTNSVCRQPLQDIGFVEDQGQLYCENCYEAYLAPVCAKCNKRIKEECLIALDKHWHTDCFICAYCNKPFGNDSFFLEDGLPYCEKDWNELFTTKCVGCGFAIEAGDRWVEALNNNYHSQCFKCTICHKNLEGQSFYAKAGRPICKAHAR